MQIHNKQPIYSKTLEEIPVKSFNIVLKTCQYGEKKIAKEETKLLLLSDNITTCTESPRELT